MLTDDLVYSLIACAHPSKKCSDCPRYREYSTNCQYDLMKEAASKIEHLSKMVADNQISAKLNYCSIFDEEEIHENVTVQILKNSITGDVSFGWWDPEDIDS